MIIIIMRDTPLRLGDIIITMGVRIVITLLPVGISCLMRMQGDDTQNMIMTGYREVVATAAIITAASLQPIGVAHLYPSIPCIAEEGQ
jgi:hypothetical protein